MNAFLQRLRQEAVDVVIVVLLYVLVEFARTETVKPDDWSTWGWGVVFGAAYRAAPEIIAFLGRLRGSGA